MLSFRISNFMCLLFGVFDFFFLIMNSVRLYCNFVLRFRMVFSLYFFVLSFAVARFVVD